ncbi:MAG: hypothetical protein ACFFAS_20330 [Promethearchaeota archaeon]
MKKKIKFDCLEVLDYKWKKINGENNLTTEELYVEDDPGELITWNGHLAVKSGNKLVFLPKDKYIYLRIDEQ